MSNPERIPPEKLEEFARALGLRQAILVGWAPDGVTHVVTWGDSLVDSAQAAQGGNVVKRALGFPECLCCELSPRVAAAMSSEGTLAVIRKALAKAERETDGSWSGAYDALDAIAAALAGPGSL